jgi:branched-chain amino acid transport system substrate-binding protein
MNLDTKARYSESHEWARKEGNLIVCGISDHSQQELSDITCSRRSLRVVAAVLLASLSLWVMLAILGAGEPFPAAAAPWQLIPDESRVITIGVAADLTGPVAVIGERQVRAAQLAVSQTNAAGGIGIGGQFYSIRLAVVDDQCDSTRAITSAYQLLAAGSVAVVGHTCSAASGPASGIYRDAGVAMVTSSSTNPLLTHQGYTNTFRVCSNDAASAVALAQYFHDAGYRRAAILVDPDGWSDLLAATFASAFQGLGGSVVSQTLHSTDEITPAVNAIQGQGVDVIEVSDVLGNNWAAAVSRAAYSLGLTQSVAWLGADDQYITDWAGPQAAEGDFGANPWHRIADMPGYAAFAAAYAAAYGAAPVGDLAWYQTPYAYDAANLVLDAIGRAGTPTDTLAIRDALAATSNYSGAVDIYRGFDTYGDLTPQWARVEAVRNSQWVPAAQSTTFYAGQGGTLDMENSLGQTTTLQIPADAVQTTLHITYTLVATHTSSGVPTLTMVGGRSYRFEASAPLSARITVTIQYADGDIAGLDESTLALYTWDGSQWVDAQPCGGYLRDLDHNTLQAIICHFSDYALLAHKQFSWSYLPLLLRH